MVWRGTEVDGYDEDESVFWEPDKDDTLQGTVKWVGKGKYNTFMVVEGEDGVTYKTPQHSLLSRQIRKLEIQEDDLVHITFLGEGEEPDDPAYSAPKLYKLLKWVPDGEGEE